ncbi:hypothetical protein DEU56DRAFT_541734 [Suillus clintonianus]|uniref:uncharacterized protein n=1 Tax=Suillus clintonianus TaxID=1904413 RepID=UPI001B860C3F|nr:uncharacterized protein DEU56DRAFT_541734 [Suillus clintonianus]KAG2126551.1 hypothetical protein DEU56DRAFT_541734 [Suillus clintonianus]
MASLLPDDILFMIFKLVCEDGKEAFHEFLEGRSGTGAVWDDWGDAFELEGDEWEPACDIPPPSTLLAAAVCKRWQSFVTQTPSMWTELRISFHEGAAALEHAQRFLRCSGSHLLHITLLWDDPSWISPDIVEDADTTGLKYTTRGEIMAGVQLILVIQELYAHVHRWREFTLRTTSIAHTYQALSLLSRPSVHPAHKLEKLHLQFIHNPRHATHSTDEPSLFPGSVPPIRGLLLFGINWAWPSSHMFSQNLVDLRVYYDGYCTTSLGTPEPAKVLSQLLGALVNLQTLALELELVDFAGTTPIELPHLHTLAIKSRSMESWTAAFLHDVHMPEMRILTLCVATLEQVNSVEGVFDELATLTDPDATDPDADDPSSYLLELEELHLLNFRHSEQPELLHRLFTQMSFVDTLTLGPGTNDGNVKLAMALLPTPYGLPDLPLSSLRTLVAFDVPKNVMRHIVLERTMLYAPLEELYYHEGREDKSVEDDWQHHVEKYHRIGNMSSEHYADVVGRRWSYLA